MDDGAEDIAEDGRNTRILEGGVWVVQRAIGKPGPGPKAAGFLCSPLSCPGAEGSAPLLVKNGRAFPGAPGDIDGFVVQVNLPSAWSSHFKISFAEGILGCAGAALPSAVRSAGKRGGRSCLLLVFSDAAAAERARDALDGACTWERANLAEAAFWAPATA